MNEIIAVILSAIINSVAVIFVGIMSINNANKIKDIENEKEAMKLYIEFGGKNVANSIVKEINKIENEVYDLNYEIPRILMSANREVRNKLKIMCEKDIKNKSKGE